jgi:hypothetical protein
VTESAASPGWPFLGRIQRQFFYAGDARRVNGFRIAYCLALAGSILLTASGFDDLFRTPVYNPIPLFEGLGIPFFSLRTFQLLRVALLACLGLAAAGVLTRPALAGSCGLYFLYLGTHLGQTKQPGTNYVYHSDNMAFFVLLVLAAAPKIGLLGVEGWWKRGRRWAASDEEAACSEWVFPTLLAALGLCYFGSAWCKLSSSLLWADGSTLQGYLAAKYLSVDAEWGFRLAQSWWLCLLGGIATLVFELFFWTVVLFPRFAKFYGIAGLLFHGIILLTMKINFFNSHGLVYLAFLFWPSPGMLKPGGVEAPAAPRPGWAQMGFSLGLVAALLACDLFRIESWPFSDYRVFWGRTNPDNIHVFRVGVIDGKGRLSWPRTEDLARSETTLDREFSHYVKRQKTKEAMELLEKVRASMPPEVRRNFQEIALVVRAVRTGPDGRLEPVNEVLLTLPAGD